MNARILGSAPSAAVWIALGACVLGAAALVQREAPVRIGGPSIEIGPAPVKEAGPADQPTPGDTLLITPMDPTPGAAGAADTPSAPAYGTPSADGDQSIGGQAPAGVQGGPSTSRFADGDPQSQERADALRPGLKFKPADRP